MGFDARTIAIGGVTAGLLLGAWGVVRSDGGAGERHATRVGALTSPAPRDGIKSAGEVVAFWERRVEAAPSGFLDRTQLGVALATLARETADLDLYERSENVLREALRVNPNYGAARLALAQSLHGQHEFAEAGELAREVLLAEPSSLGALALLGDTSLELGDYDAASDHYGELAGRERSAPVVSRLARLASVRGGPDLAVELADEALRLSDRLALAPADQAFYRFQLGHFRFEAGDVGGAIDALESALELAPTHPGTNERLAFVYASAGRRDEAEALYRALLDAGPAADLHGSYADLLRARGAVADAEVQERLAMELALATIDAVPAERRHVARFLTTRDPGLAVELAEVDLAERADVGAFDALAWALYHDGQVARADDVVAEALAIGARTAELLYHAGAIAHAKGDDERAEGLLREALDVNPAFHPFDAAAAAALLADPSS